MNSVTKTLAPIELYNRLFQAYGPQGWWPVTDPGAEEPTHDPARPKHTLSQAQQWEVFVGALLTQNTAWSNVEKALARLRVEGLTDLMAVAAAPLRELAEAVRPAGYYNQKSARLKGLAHHLLQAWQGDFARFFDRPTPSVRDELLALKGVGPETADSILLYAGNGRHTVFVVDAYTFRLVDRLGWRGAPASYQELQALFHSALASGFASSSALAALYKEYHALIVVHGKTRCRARKPTCGGCPLLQGCRQGRS